MRRLARPLLYLGTAAVVLGLGKLHAKYVGHYVLHGTARFSWSLSYCCLLCLAAYAVGLPELHRSGRSALTASVGAVGAATVGISLAALGLGSALLPRFVVFGAAAAMVPWYISCARLAAAGRVRGERQERVVAVVGPEEAVALGAELAGDPERPASVVGLLTIVTASGAGGGRPLLETVVATGATVVVLDRAAQADDTIVGQAAEVHEKGLARVRTLTAFYEEWLGKLPSSELERMSLMFDTGGLGLLRSARVKRLLDVGTAAWGFVVLVVALPIVAAANLVANRGPLFYRQVRVGRDGTLFRILKFRTMTPSGASAGDDWTSTDDPRVTRFGRILRRTHLDELPQVLNILRGELSLVGPRPEQPRYVAELVGKLPFYDLRHLVRPGLTGWAQVKFGYAGDERDALEKLQYDFYYLRHQGLTLDLRIVGRTLRSVAGGGGR